MRINIKNLSKVEIVERLQYRCKHRHDGISHSSCYDSENKKKQKIGFFDIESSGLEADFAIMWSWAIKDEGGKIISNCVTPKELKNETYDKRLCQDFIDIIDDYDCLVGHYSSRFDFPFIRSRSVYWGLDFPMYGSIAQVDTWRILKYKFKIHSNRLQTACDYFGIPSKGHPMKQSVWLRAFGGDPEALKWIVKHNEEDVLSTEAVYQKIREYARKTNSSI